ncbi:hypothetical protein BTVI_115474 [Pitangus sulphuratus]|nr:hypothetical protein BTVI_115474 [Pitangus sulphuratus]
MDTVSGSPLLHVPSLLTPGMLVSVSEEQSEHGKAVRLVYELLVTYTWSENDWSLKHLGLAEGNLVCLRML